MQQDYYQIYHNHHPMLGQSFNSIRSARLSLNDLYLSLKDCSPLLGYTVQKRSTFTRNLLGVKRIYLDGSVVCDTYLIQHVILQPTIVKF